MDLLITRRPSYDPFLVFTSYRKPTREFSAARNLGLKIASGKFLIFLDADDRLLPNAVINNLLCFEAHPAAGLVYGAFRTINSQGDILKTFPLHPPGADPYRALLFGNIIGMIGTVMYRRDRLLAVGGFDTSLKFCEDLDVYLRIAKEFPLACTQELIAEYRQHDAQTTRDFTPVLRGALTVVKKHKKGIVDFRKVTDFWKGWYARRHAERLVEAVMSRSISSHLMIETIKMLTVAPLALVKAFGSVLEARRGVERQ